MKFKKNSFYGISLPKKEQYKNYRKEVKIMAEVKLTKNNFESEVLGSDIPVLVDFWASWCGPCKMLMPVLEEIAKEYDGKIKIGKINVDEESELSEQFKIMSIPTLMLFKSGKLEKKAAGYAPKADILNFAEL